MWCLNWFWTAVLIIVYLIVVLTAWTTCLPKDYLDKNKME